MTDDTNQEPPPGSANDDNVVLCQTTDADNAPEEGKQHSIQENNSQEPPVQEQQTGEEKPQSPEAVTEGCLQSKDRAAIAVEESHKDEPSKKSSNETPLDQEPPNEAASGTTDADNAPEQGKQHSIPGEEKNSQEPPVQEQQTREDKPQSPEAVTEGCLLDIDGNPFPNDKISAAQPTGDDAKDKSLSEEHVRSSSSQPDIETGQEAGPTVPTSETPKGKTSSSETTKPKDGAAIAVEESQKDEPSKKSSNETPLDQEPAKEVAAGSSSQVDAEKQIQTQKGKTSKPPFIVDLCDDDDDDDDTDAKITSSTISLHNKPKNTVTDDAKNLKSVPREKPLIDIEEYRRKFCKRRKVKQFKKTMEMKKQSKPPGNADDEAKMPAGVLMPPKMAIPIGLPPLAKMNSATTRTAEKVSSSVARGSSGEANEIHRIPSKEVVGNVMDRILNRMQSNPRAGLSMEQKMKMMAMMGGDSMQSGNLGMSMDEKMKMMAMMGGDSVQSGNLGMSMDEKMKMMAMGMMDNSKQSRNPGMSIDEKMKMMAMRMRNDTSNYMPSKFGLSMDEKMNMMEDHTFGMSMEDKMKMMAMMNMGENRLRGDGMMDNHAARRMELGMNMGMGQNMGGGSSMRPESNPPGNLQELREMMGKDMEMNRMFGRFNSNSSANMDSKKGDSNMENSEFMDSIFSRMGSKGSTSSKAMINSLPNRRDSTDTKGSLGSEVDFMKAPMLPTPALTKPSLKSNYKDISFSPLDQLHPDLMSRMIALQGKNKDMSHPRMPFASDEHFKRKFSDSVGTPRSPNPKKSFLERHRIMDLEMKGHLDEAMANFGKFQKKYSGDPSSSAMMGLNDPSTLGSDNIAIAPSTVTTSGKTKKNKAKQKPKVESTKTKETDPRKPKRPFSAYNIFFQLEREAIIHRATLGLDLLKDKIEKDYYYKVKNGEVIDEDDLPKQNKPFSSDHEPPDPSAPDRYKNLRMEKFWYRSGAKAKRRHRKSKGPSVPFLELTRMISRRWASIDEISPDIKKYCNKLALNELEHYKEDMENYKKLKSEEQSLMERLKQYDSSNGSEASSVGEVMMPKRKRPKQLDKQSAMPYNTSSIMPGLVSQTPNPSREQMFDPQFASRFTDISKMSFLGSPQEQRAKPLSGGGSGLPPPPLFSDNNGPPFMSMASRGGDVVGDRSAALADARRRMLMDMQSMGLGGPIGDLPGGMSSMMTGMLLGHDTSDRAAQLSNIHQHMTRNQYLPPGRGDSSSDIVNMMMRNRAMGMDLDRLSHANLGLPGNANGFDDEVERFLSTLGNNRMMAGSGGAADGGYGGEAMINRMVMMERMMAQTNSANMGSGLRGFSQLPSFSQQSGSDNPQLPEISQLGNQGSNNNSRSASRGPS